MAMAVKESYPDRGVAVPGSSVRYRIGDVPFDGARVVGTVLASNPVDNRVSIEVTTGTLLRIIELIDGAPKPSMPPIPE